MRNRFSCNRSNANCENKDERSEGYQNVKLQTQEDKKHITAMEAKSCLRGSYSKRREGRGNATLNRQPAREEETGVPTIIANSRNPKSQNILVTTTRLSGRPWQHAINALSMHKMHDDQSLQIRNEINSDNAKIFRFIKSIPTSPT